VEIARDSLQGFVKDFYTDEPLAGFTALGARPTRVTVLASERWDEVRFCFAYYARFLCQRVIAQGYIRDAFAPSSQILCPSLDCWAFCTSSLSVATVFIDMMMPGREQLKLIINR